MTPPININRQNPGFSHLTYKHEMKPKKLVFVTLGNGITVYDGNKELRDDHLSNGDYQKVAHIDSQRNVTIYDNPNNCLTDSEIHRINEFAWMANPKISQSQDKLVFLVEPKYKYVITGKLKNGKRFTPIYTNTPQHYNIWEGTIWSYEGSQKKVKHRINN
jgi:hypothetical protein